MFIVFLLVSMVAAAGRLGCRVCTGSKTIKFDPYVSQNWATSFLGDTFGNCNTGNDWQVTLTIAGGDHPGSCAQSPFACKEYKFNLRINSYCGNGPTVLLNKGPLCSGPLCSVSDTLSLTCTQNVACKSVCDCRTCGC